LSIKNTNLSESTWFIYDSYLLFKRLIVDQSIDTSHTCFIYDSTTPIITNEIYTEHRASVKGGKVFIIDYYTPGDWWNLSTSDSLYTHTVWNRFENILQYFGRFYHSPYLYNTQLPKLNTIKIAMLQNSPYFEIIEDVYDVNIATTLSSSSDSSITSIVFDNDKYLTLFGSHISPNLVLDDGTYYRVSTSIQDNTVMLGYYYMSDGTNFPYTETNTTHPFVADHTFYLSFYGRKAYGYE
jgi:hypothetical protein